MIPIMSARAQSAMEYLMTYGWAILIIAVVLGALFSLGVFSGSSLLGNACVAGPGYYCKNIVYYHGTVAAGSAAGNILVTVGQNTGVNWVCCSASFAFVPQGTPYSGGIPQVNFVAVENTVSTLGSGQSVPVVLPVTGVSGTINTGTAESGTIWAVYQTASGSGLSPLQYAQVATVNVKAS